MARKPETISESKLSEYHWYPERALMDGYVLVARDNAPKIVAKTCEEWFDGIYSAMYRFYRGEPVKPAKLLKEIEKAIKENIDPTNVAALEESRAWVAHQLAVVKQIEDIREGFTKLNALRDGVTDIVEIIKNLADEARQ